MCDVCAGRAGAEIAGSGGGAALGLNLSHRVRTSFGDFRRWILNRLRLRLVWGSFRRLVVIIPFIIGLRISFDIHLANLARFSTVNG